MLSRFAFEEWSDESLGCRGMCLSYEGEVVGYVWTEWRELGGEIQPVQFRMVEGDDEPDCTIADGIASVFTLICRWALRDSARSVIFEGLPMRSLEDAVPTPPWRR